MYFFTLLTATLITVALSADPTCSTGLPTGKLCCAKVCGICGGQGCGARSRATKTLCCKGAILNSPKNCLTSDPPCKITTTDENFMAGSDIPDPKCATGLFSRKACCPAECSVCGGTGCKPRGRLIKSDCCVGSIKNRKISCDVKGPPCVVQEPEKTMAPVVTPEMLPEITPMPDICAMKMRPVGGCFCFVVLKRIISIRKRYKYVKICVDKFGRRTINRMATECKKYTEGSDAENDVKDLVREVNLLIPKCYPVDTPLVKFRA